MCVFCVCVCAQFDIVVPFLTNAIKAGSIPTVRLVARTFEEIAEVSFY